MENENSRIVEKLIEYTPFEGAFNTSIEGLALARRDYPTKMGSCFYEPVCIVIFQGQKEFVFDNKTANYGENKFLVSCANIPAKCRVKEASPEKPCLAVMLKLDSYILSKLILELDLSETRETNKTALASSELTPELRDAFCRLIRLLERPADEQKVLSPMIIKEIYYRILTGPLGCRLRLMNTKGTSSYQIMNAISFLKNKYKEKINMEELAQVVNMAPSSFYRCFKKITKISPLQYQKQLRLYEAQKLMLSGDYDAGSASFEVGYESPTQFSREYKKFFGNPPLRDVRKLAAEPAVSN